MTLTEQTQFISTVGDIMSLMASLAGTTVPSSTEDDYTKWLTWIQVKYEEASRRGFWRRLLAKDTVSVSDGATEVLLPVRFQRANSLYIFELNGVDLADPNRTPDGIQIYPLLENNPSSSDFGRWKLTFNEEVDGGTATIWYFATPPKPTASSDKVLLPGDMIAYGALISYFADEGLVGSQDDARQEYENRIVNYLAMEMVPPRSELLNFSTNPQGVNRTLVARQRYSVRPDRLVNNY